MSVVICDWMTLNDLQDMINVVPQMFARKMCAGTKHYVTFRQVYADETTLMDSEVGQFAGNHYTHDDHILTDYSVSRVCLPPVAVASTWLIHK